MPVLTEEEFRKKRTAGTLPGLVVLYGEESYLVLRAARKIVADAEKNIPFPDFNLQRFDGDSSLGDILTAVEALPFMAEQKLVTVRDYPVDALSPSDTEQLKELIGNIPESTLCLFSFSSVAVDAKKNSKWRSFLQLAGKHGSVVEYPRRTGPELEKWLCAEAARRQCELSRRDAAEITARSGSDLQTLENEIQKLCAFVGQGPITREHIEKIVSRNLETTVFMLSNALAAGNYDRSFLLLDQLFYQNEDPISVLAVLSSAFVDMYRVQVALQDGGTYRTPGEWFDYKGRDFRLRNAQRDGHGLSAGQLRRVLGILLETDAKMKSSRTQNRILLEEMMTKLLLITKGRQEA